MSYNPFTSCPYQVPTTNVFAPTYGNPFASPYPSQYGIPQSFPPFEPLTRHIGFDPRSHGTTNYVYKTSNGDAPNQGMTPGVMQQPQSTNGMLPMAPTGVMLSQYSLMHTPAVPSCGRSRETNGSPRPPVPRSIYDQRSGDYTVRYFSDAVDQMYNGQKEDHYQIPDIQFTKNIHKMYFAPETTIEKVIRDIKCENRATQHRFTDPQHIGIQEIQRVVDGECEVGRSVFLTSPEAQFTIEEWVGKKPREILVVRLPVCK